MGNNYSYNGETDFLKWYKTNTGTDFDESGTFVRPEGMDDGAYNVGSTLYKYYVQGKNDSSDKAEEVEGVNNYHSDNVASVNQRYQSSINALNNQKQASLEQASTVYDRLKKYLPMAAKAQGLSSLGVSASSALEAYNTYSGQLGDIAKNYSDNVSGLEASKNEQISALDKYKTEQLASLDKEYNALERSRTEKAGAEAGSVWDKYLTDVERSQNDTFDLVMSGINSATETDESKLLNYIAPYAGKVSAEQYATLEQAAKNKAASNTQASADKATGEKTATYNTVYNVLSTSSSTKVDELLGYIEQYKGKISDEQYAALVQIAKNVAEYNRKQEASADAEKATQTVIDSLEALLYDEKYDEAALYLEANKETLGNGLYTAYNGLLSHYVNSQPQTQGPAEPLNPPGINNNGASGNIAPSVTVSGNNFTVSVGGNNYNGQLTKNENGDAKVMTDPLILAAAKDVKEEEFFVYNNKVYVKKLGNIYEVENITTAPSAKTESLINSSAKESISNNFEAISGKGGNTSSGSSSSGSSSGTVSRPNRPNHLPWTPEGSLRY